MAVWVAAAGCAAAGPLGLVPVAQLTGRVELAGFSVLPPRGGGWVLLPAAVVPTRRLPDPMLGLGGLLGAPPTSTAPRVLALDAVTAGQARFARMPVRLAEPPAVVAVARTTDARGATSAFELQGVLEAELGALPRDERGGLARWEVVADASFGPRCVRYGHVQEARAAPERPGVTLATATRAIRCLHPRWPRYAVDLSHSQRLPAGARPVAVEAEVEPFLRSLRFSTDRPLLVERWPLAPSPRGVAVGEGSVWVAHLEDGTLSRVDPATGRLVATIPVGRAPMGVAVGEGAVWVANRDDGTVSRVDPGAGRVVATVAVGREPVGVAAGGGAVWVTNRGDGTVSRVDPATNRVVGAVPVGRDPSGVAVGEGAVWVAASGSRRLVRLDPDTGRAVGSPIPLGPGSSAEWAPSLVAIGEGAVWVATRGGAVLRLDPRSGEEVARIPVGAGPAFGVAVGAGAVWVTSPMGDTVSRVDPATNRVVGKPRLVEGRPLFIAVGAGGVWVGSAGAAAVLRLEP